jgi:hypothetical protein
MTGTARGGACAQTADPTAGAARFELPRARAVARPGGHRGSDVGPIDAGAPVRAAAVPPTAGEPSTDHVQVARAADDAARRRVALAAALDHIERTRIRALVEARIA